MKKHSVYEELHYGEQEDGTCNWVGRLYYRGAPGGIAAEVDGVAADKVAAAEDFKKWAGAEIPKHDAHERELVTLTSDDVGVLDLQE